MSDFLQGSFLYILVHQEEGTIWRQVMWQNIIKPTQLLWSHLLL